MSAIRFILLALLVISPAHACININGTSLDGKSTFVMGKAPKDDILKAMEGHSMDTMNRAINESFGKNDDQELEGVIEILEENYEGAIAIFNQIEAESPGRYSTASNMGTAYELLGNNELALEWIEKGIRRNPESHQGTEWLHLAILKVKIRLAQDPTYLEKHHIIELPDDISPDSQIKVDGEQHSAINVGRALHYQLTERATFVKPKDPVMADLLFTYGVLEPHLGVVENGIGLLDLARIYGYPHRDELEQQKARYEELVFMRKAKSAAFIGLGVIAFIGFLIFAYRRRWFFLSAAAHRQHQLTKAHA